MQLNMFKISDLIPNQMKVIILKKLIFEWSYFCEVFCEAYEQGASNAHL